MQNRLLLFGLFISLSGCGSTAPKVTQVPAEQWVDELIVQSATTVSQAQTRLHQTNAVRPTVVVRMWTAPVKVLTPAAQQPIHPGVLPSGG